MIMAAEIKAGTSVIVLLTNPFIIFSSLISQQPSGFAIIVTGQFLLSKPIYCSVA
jgi:hypothetical protein